MKTNPLQNNYLVQSETKTMAFIFTNNSWNRSIWTISEALWQPSWILSFTSRLNCRSCVLTNCIILVIVLIRLVTDVKIIVIWPIDIRNGIFQSFWQPFWILWLQIWLIIDHICFSLHHFLHSLYKHSFRWEDHESIQ